MAMPRRVGVERGVRMSNGIRCLMWPRSNRSFSRNNTALPSCAALPPRNGPRRTQSQRIGPRKPKPECTQPP
eukprot:25104-Prymnesium_polylepis.1